MGDPHGPAISLPVVVEALARHSVEYLLVGGQAATIHGATRLTTDLDICIRWVPENLDRMGNVLVELDAGLRVEGMDEAFPVPHLAGPFLAPLEISTWRSPHGDIDVLRNLPSPHGHLDYEQLLERAEDRSFVGRIVKVASLGDVIVSKQTANRPSDHEALPELLGLAAKEAKRRRSTATPRRSPQAEPPRPQGHSR